MVSRILTAAVAATAIVSGAAAANAANFVQSPHATGAIEQSAAPASVDVTTTGSIDNGSRGGQAVAPYGDGVGVKSLRIQSVSPYAGR